MEYQGKDEKLQLAGGKLERLEQQVQQLLLESKDAAFTEYLRGLIGRVRSQIYQTDLLQDELERFYKVYLQRMEQKAKEEENAGRSQPLAICPPVAMQYEASQAPKAIEMPCNAMPKLPVKKNAKSATAMTALSAVGGVFILIALFFLGMTVKNGLVKGIGMYIVSLTALLVSEIFIYRKYPKPGVILSAFSVVGLYLATMFNYGSFHNCDFWSTLIIILTLSVVMIVISKRKNSAFYRVLGMSTCYLCMFSLQWVFTDDKLIALLVFYFFMNALCILFPVKLHNTSVNLTQMCLNMLFSCTILMRPEDYGTAPIISLIFLGGAILVHQLLLIIQVRYQRKEAALGKAVDNVGLLTVYWLGIIFYSNLCCVLCEASFWMRNGSMLVVALLCFLSFVVLRGGSEKWYSYYFLNIAAFLVYCSVDTEAEWCMAVMLLTAKLLSLTGEKVLRVSEAFITAASCVMLFICMDKYPGGFVLCAVILLSVLFTRHTQTFYECIATFTVALFAGIHLGDVDALILPFLSGLLFAAQLLFNSVKRFRGKNILVFNILIWICQGICCFMLGCFEFANEYLGHFCVLIFGVATVILIFRDNYDLAFKGKYLVLAFYLSCMTLILKTPASIINSILLILIALVSIGTGFVWHRKEIRIYGLVLSLLVCGKIVLYDYWGIPILQRLALFFAAGAIALIITGIYIVLEKKNNMIR